MGPCFFQYFWTVFVLFYLEFIDCATFIDIYMLFFSSKQTMTLDCV